MERIWSASCFSSESGAVFSGALERTWSTGAVHNHCSMRNERDFQLPSHALTASRLAVTLVETAVAATADLHCETVF